jgi:dolichol-phosphate mannosyltransferase
MEISVVIPLYHEESIIDLMAERLIQVSHPDWEWVFVDDGSRDRTVEKLKPWLDRLGSWQLIRLSRNFGQQAAYRAGLDVAKGRAVVFLDADLQDPPEKIPEMVEAWKQGAKLVVGVRLSRAERGFKGMLFRLFHQLFYRVTSGVMPQNSGTFGLMDRLIVDELKKMPERSLFLQALRGWVGYSKSTISYHRGARIGGEVKQSYRKLFGQAWDGVTSFSTLPIQWISTLGLLISFFGFIYAAFLLGIKGLQFFGKLQTLDVPGFTTVSVAVLCLGGIQLIAIGVLGQYLGRIYDEVKQRPTYIVASHESRGV